MNQPERFKAAAALSPEGRLMTFGNQEKPDPEAIHRAARRLGISAAALTSAAAATAIAPAASAATSSATAVGLGSAGTVVGKSASLYLVTSVVKGTLIGLGLTIATYSSVQWMDSHAPVNAPSATTVPVQANRQRNAKAPVIASAPSLLQDPPPATAEVPRVLPSSANTAGAIVTEPAREPVIASIRGAAATARFEDSEPASLPPIQTSSSMDANSSSGRSSAAAGAPSSRSASADVRLAREVASLDRVRALANRGDATGALSELNGFGRSLGYVALQKEALLVHIDVLLSLGRKAEAIAIARQLLAIGAPATQRNRLDALIRSQP